MDNEYEILLIHLGALGDVCVSESIFLSLRRFTNKRIVAVGNRRILLQFQQYFDHIESIDSRIWGYLFSEMINGPQWPIIVLIGKDPQGSLRQRLTQITDNFIFISMYPDNRKIKAEDYQLSQLLTYGIEPIKREIMVALGSRILLYPELSHTKAKWPIDHFMEVYESLKNKGYEPIVLRQKGLTLPIPGTEMPDNLEGVAEFFTEGGLFLSNDSGMAHFAARYGLKTLCIFYDENASIWQPRNSTVISAGSNRPTVEEVVELIISFTKKSLEPKTQM
jgi:ADP-heptose:LPS heptosyltransferase